MSLENLIFRCLERFWSQKSQEKFAVVTSYDPDKHAAKVKIQPEDIETGWLPIHAHHVGNGWGVVIGLQVGDQVRVTHQGGDLESGMVLGRVHDDDGKPPKAESGEMIFKHEKAGSIKFDKNKNITWTGANGQVIVTDKKGNASISLKVSSKQDSDANSPTYTLSLEDQNGKKHSVAVSKDGVAHSSDVKVSVSVDSGNHTVTVDKDNGISHKSSKKVKITAPKIEHEGDLKVSGHILADGEIQSNVGLRGPILEGSIGFLPDENSQP